MMQIIPLSSSQGSPIVQQSQVLDLSSAPSNAEQSLMARGLSSVYDPNQEAEEQTVKPVADTRAVIALSATPSEALDNRSDTGQTQEQSLLDADSFWSAFDAGFEDAGCMCMLQVAYSNLSSAKGCSASCTKAVGLL